MENQELKIEEGKAYRTRNGHKAVIKFANPPNCGIFAVFGKIMDVANGDNASWKPCGGYMPSGTHDLDLVAEWKEEEEAAEPAAAPFICTASAISVLNNLAMAAHHNAIDKGFYGAEMLGNPALQIALIHSEASELLESYRKDPEQSAKIVGFSTSEEEAADIIIRVLDMASHRNMRIGQAIIAKMAYNSTRPTKHGKRF